MTKPIIFEFGDIGTKPLVATNLTQAFAKHHTEVVQITATSQIRRISGYKYKEINLTFADSQTVVLRVKETGDIFQVMVNKKIIPIKHQDDQKLAIIEIVNVLDAGRAKWQKKLLAAKTPKIPKSILTPAPKMIEALTTKRDALKEAITAVREEIGVMLKTPT